MRLELDEHVYCSDGDRAAKRNEGAEGLLESRFPLSPSTTRGTRVTMSSWRLGSLDPPV